jgi:SAM-dependent methyltransferase
VADQGLGAPARSFGTVAERYDRYRPTYSADAIAWALGDRPLRVADVGAGTGILSRLLLSAGHEVVAIEPDDRMRAQLEAATPGLTSVAGTAERIPLPDGSVDAVVAGQAYHWFDPARTLPEVARVLRPGGVFAPMWNDADHRQPWTVRYGEIIDGPEAVHIRPASDFGALFGPVAVGEFNHDIWLRRDDLLALATTRSPYVVGTLAQRRDLLQAIEEMIAQFDLGGSDPIRMPHVTRVHRAILAAPDPI